MKSVCLCFPSKSFIVPSVTFRSLVHFEFIFVYAVKQCSNFFFFKCYCPVLPAPYIYCLFSIVCSCLFCCRLTIGQSVCRFSRLVVSDSLQPHEIYISGFPAHHQLLARRYIGLFLGCLSVTWSLTQFLTQHSWNPCNFLGDRSVVCFNEATLGGLLDEGWSQERPSHD